MGCRSGLGVGGSLPGGGDCLEGRDQRELSRLILDAQLGKFQRVLVWALDRLTREGVLAIMLLVKKLAERGCQIVSLQEPWTETAGPFTELLLSISGWMASMESQRRSERTKAGMERAKAEGKHIGRPMGATDSYRRKRSR